MVAFRRVFSADPGVQTLLNVGSINIIDQAPPSLPFAAGTGMLLVVGEFERGPLQTPTEVVNPGDRQSVFGGLGWTVDGTPFQGPVAQQSGGSEPWNGSGFIHMANKVYNRLAIQRVDNSAGSVQFSRLACLTGGPGPYQADDGDTAVFELNGGPTTATATVNATAAEIQAAGAIYPLVSPGGLTLIFAYDDMADADAMTVVLQDTDVALADVIARINAKFAATIASNSGGQLLLSSVRQGSGARFKILGGTGLADVGLPTAVVNDLWTITVTADTAITTEVRVSRYVDGVLTNFDTEPFLGPVGSVTAKRNKLLSDTVTDPPQLSELGVPGFTFASSGIDAITVTGDDNQILTGITALQGGAELTIVNTTPGVALEVFGTGNVYDSQSITATEAANIIDAVANLSASVDDDGNLRVCNELTPVTGTLKGDSGDWLTALEFDTTTIADAADSENVVIPAGTRVQDSTSTGTVWVTMVDTETGTGGGPFDLKVRPFIDTDTAVASNAGDVTVVLSSLPDGFSVDNSSSITRLTAAQLDARYITAIQETIVNAAPSNAVNWIVSARTSAAIRAELRTNARTATAAGLAGRKAIVRPRLGITVATAITEVAVTRDERVQFAFPGFQTAINEIRSVGAVGGVGFADDGVVNVGSDFWLATFRTIIRPEESAAMEPSITNYGPFQVVGLEETYDPGTEGSTKLDVNNYIAFKREGITAPALDRSSGAGFVDDVTSVVETDTGRRPANRRAFADFINDSLLAIGQPYKARVITPNLNRQIQNSARAFLRQLQSPDQPNNTRLAAFIVTDVTDPAQPNLLRMSVRVEMYATADAIVYETTVGTGVLTSQEISQAA